MNVVLTLETGAVHGITCFSYIPGTGNSIAFPAKHRSVAFTFNAASTQRLTAWRIEIGTIGKQHESIFSRTVIVSNIIYTRSSLIITTGSDWNAIAESQMKSQFIT